MDLKEIIAEAKKRGFSKEDLVKELIEKGYSKSEIEEVFGGKRVVKVRKGIDKEAAFFDKIKLLFSNPNSFFQLVRENSIKNALLMYVFVGLAFTFFGIVFFYIVSGFLYRVSFFYYGFGLIYLFIGLGIGVGLTFAYAGISHLVIKGLGGEGDYVDTYNACTYSFIPFLIISIVPYIGWLSIVYSIILMTFGLSAYHRITKGKAVIAALVPIIISVLLVGLFIAYLIFSIFRYGF